MLESIEIVVEYHHFVGGIGSMLKQDTPGGAERWAAYGHDPNLEKSILLCSAAVSVGFVYLNSLLC
jgi:hypothetical protein